MEMDLITQVDSH